MRRSQNLLFGLALTVAMVAVVVAKDKSRNEAVVGIWRGELDKLPAVLEQ